MATGAVSWSCFPAFPRSICSTPAPVLGPAGTEGVSVLRAETLGAKGPEAMSTGDARHRPPVRAGQDPPGL